MEEQSVNQFEEFLDRVIGESRLEIAKDKIGNAFLQESQRSELIRNEFIDAFTPRWNLWARKKGTHLISPFIGEQGIFIFKLWLSFVYSFNYRRLQVECEKGESMVDSQGWIKYTYTSVERQLIKKICDKYEIEMPEEEVSRLLLTNAIKSIDPTISKIVDTKYKINIDKIDSSESMDALTIRVDFVGRIA